MERKEIWVEGSFAGEFQVEQRSKASGGESEAVPDGEGRFARDCHDYGDYDDCQDYDDCDDWNDGDDWDDYADDDHDDGFCKDAKSPRNAKGESHRRSGSNKELGRRGERAAAEYFGRIGYEVLETNYTCPFGEADIVARDGRTLVFVEVKTRSGVAKGFPSEAVDARKRARYEKIAGWYLGDYEEVNIPVRFDVVALMVVAPDRAFLRHYKNAFAAGF